MNATAEAKPAGPRLPPGSVVALERLGRLAAPEPDLLPVSVFHIAYWSQASSGSRLAAKLFVPEGKAPAGGWPVSVFSHGVGDPALPYRRWPLAKLPMRGSYGRGAGGWAHHGYASFVPWLPGAGESEHWMTYSPLSLARNGQGLIDGFTALRQVAAMLSVSPNLAGGFPLEPRLDFTRQVLRVDCMSSALLIDFLARYRGHPMLAGLKALVGDDFQPSIAYNTAYMLPYIHRLPGRAYAGMRALWSRVVWPLAADQGWPLEEFFSPAAIAALGEEVDTPVGKRPRLYASLVLPPWSSELGNHLYAAACQALGGQPSARQTLEWVLSPGMVDLGDQADLGRVLAHPFYRRWFAAADPWFEGSIEPYASGIPLIVVARDDETPAARLGLPEYAERFEHMIRPKLETLRRWGWPVEIYRPGALAGTSFSGGVAQRAVIKRLGEIV